jgi:hypothetical protein
MWWMIQLGETWRRSRERERGDAGGFTRAGASADICQVSKMPNPAWRSRFKADVTASLSLFEYIPFLFWKLQLRALAFTFSLLYRSYSLEFLFFKKKRFSTPSSIAAKKQNKWKLHYKAHGKVYYMYAQVVFTVITYKLLLFFLSYIFTVFYFSLFWVVLFQFYLTALDVIYAR